MTDTLDTETLTASLWRHALLPGHVCRDLRIVVGATQDAVAEQIDRDRATVSRYESGSRLPRGEQGRRYQEVLITFARTAREMAEAGLLDGSDRRSQAFARLPHWIWTV